MAMVAVTVAMRGATGGGSRLTVADGVTGPRRMRRVAWRGGRSRIRQEITDTRRRRRRRDTTWSWTTDEGARDRWEVGGGRWEVPPCGAPLRAWHHALVLVRTFGIGVVVALAALVWTVFAVQTWAQTPSTCSSARLLAAGADASEQNGLWWIWPDDGVVRQITSGGGGVYLVAISPDQRWVAYYQGPDNYNPATDRFVVDTWVFDIQTEERTKLVDGSSPLGWLADSSALVLGQHPNQMVLVPSGQLVSTQGTLIYAQSMRTVFSPDQRLRAVVDTTSRGADAVSILDSGSGDEVWHIPTGRGAPQLAWSPDAQRLAFTSGMDAGGGMEWRLRMANLGDRSVQVPQVAQQLSLDSVVWVPPPADCS
jgi:hypothetical protein